MMLVNYGVMLCIQLRFAGNQEYNSRTERGLILLKGIVVFSACIRLRGNGVEFVPLVLPSFL